ncbi:MAG: hypothetical protein JNL42_23900, partial [Anaerolineae bacterium]|nr:hypothetical protein [Anaerolineae bacterium]
MLTLYLMAVDSRLASDDEMHVAGIHSGQFPGNWRMMAHQMATIHTLEHSDVPIVINQAMTGDGKSFAGQYMLFSQGWQTFTMVPTNELARDQNRSLDMLLANWTPHYWRGRGRPIDRRLINAPELDALELETALSDFSRTQLLTMLLKSDYVLTNPDVFHLAINQFAYRDGG